VKRILRVAFATLGVLALAGVAAGVWLWNDPVRSFELAMAAGRARAGVAERFVEIDGRRWRVLDTASAPATDDARRTCLVLHGLGTTAEAMMEVARMLPATHRVVIPDLPGFGDHAPHGDAPHDWRLYIDAIERFRIHEELGQVDVVGTSMGGALAAAYAATHPGAVRRIVLLSPAGVVAPRQNDFMARVAAGELPLDIKDDASFDEMLRLNFPKPPPIPAPVRAEFIARAVERRDAFLRIVEDLRPFLVHGVEPMMADIKVPALVLYGSLDLITDPSMIEVWQAGLPSMEGEVLDDAGHVLLYDKPAEVGERMRAFLGAGE
jgi:abhydrolase domain-containing protein 6